LNVAEAVQTRRSIRNFTDEPVNLETLRRVLDAARWAPSGSNFQPWQATVLTGEPLKRLKDKIYASVPQDPIEYNFSTPEQSPRHLARRQAEGAAWYGALGIARDDREGRNDIARQNIVSYGALVLLLCYLERFHTAPQWADLGMWLQTVMLRQLTMAANSPSSISSAAGRSRKLEGYLRLQPFGGSCRVYG
jgi:hypothetical protein